MDNFEEELGVLKNVKQELEHVASDTAGRILKYLTEWNNARPAGDA